MKFTMRENVVHSPDSGESLILLYSEECNAFLAMVKLRNQT